MTKSKTKLLKVDRKGSVSRATIRKAVEKAFGVSADKKAILKKAS